MDITGSDVVQSIINGLCMGGTYVLIGLGLTLILGIMNILQFAHGDVYMIGAFTVYLLCVLKGLNLYLAVVISMATTAVLGLILRECSSGRLRDIPLVRLRDHRTQPHPTNSRHACVQ